MAGTAAAQDSPGTGQLLFVASEVEEAVVSIAAVADNVAAEEGHIRQHTTARRERFRQAARPVERSRTGLVLREVYLQETLVVCRVGMYDGRDRDLIQ